MLKVAREQVAPPAGAGSDPLRSVSAEQSAGGVLEAGDLVEDELLVEEISIDGMCGVY